MSILFYSLPLLKNGLNPFFWWKKILSYLIEIFTLFLSSSAYLIPTRKKMACRSIYLTIQRNAYYEPCLLLNFTCVEIVLKSEKTFLLKYIFKICSKSFFLKVTGSSKEFKRRSFSLSISWFFLTEPKVNLLINKPNISWEHGHAYKKE